MPAGRLWPSETITRLRTLAAPSVIVMFRPETRSPDFRVIPSRAALLRAAVFAGPSVIERMYQAGDGARGSIK